MYTVHCLCNVTWATWNRMTDKTPALLRNKRSASWCNKQEPIVSQLKIGTRGFTAHILRPLPSSDVFVIWQNWKHKIMCHWLCQFLKVILHNKRSSAKPSFPQKNLSSQLTHWELTFKLTVCSFWGHSVRSQWTYKMSSHCELTVSFLNLQLTHELVVSNLWDHPDELTMYCMQW